MKLIISAFMLFATAQSALAGVNFDQGVDVQAVIKEVSASEVKIPEARYGTPLHTTRDCKKITFTDTSPLASDEIKLRSVEMYQDCIPQGPLGGQICFPRNEVFNETAQIIITEPRVLKPGQTETFEVCLYGPFLSMKQVTPAYKYDVKRVLNVFRLTPQAVPAGTKAPAAGTCRLVNDDKYFCVYQCKDGSYISKPNPFIHNSAPGFEMPFHGCLPTASDSPFIVY